ncbi:MAG: CHAT domain-containing protein [Phormidesmis sp.]
MTQPNSEPANNTFNISNSTLTNTVGSGSIIYNESTNAASQVEAEQPKQVILFLAANPVTTQPLRLDEEVREIEAGLRRSKHRDHFKLEQRWAVQPRDLQRAMLDHTPQIVHFSGHGENEAGLILENVGGQPQLVSTAALSALFELFTDSLTCVILNACYSEQQACVIAQYIPYVIGMNQAIGDRAAIEFAVGFYDALGAGESVDRAYKMGLVAIRLAGIPEHLTPTLLKQSSPPLSL